MKVIFVDGENVGLKVVEKIDSALSDKVLIFSKSANIEQHCHKALFQHFSNYPSGSNQADFSIIANLSKYLTVYDTKSLSKAEFTLYTNDQDLISAFEFQCEEYNLKAKIIRTRETAKPVPLPVFIEPNSPDEKVFKALEHPRALSPELQEELGLTRQVFTRVVNSLSASNSIKRSPENKKLWVQC
ncbi:conserved hypothetical protein [Vibrio aestuarianus]|uniref:hypothetical protein n=1 Tax=Vibrio aestuarianus TaxID=28171 RepID=UPI0014560C68|nr:hypothetical protein [Vibrio aestuarianus]NLS56585.1 hypothetical protein [Vibrio aestuarianus subsp. francensis]CAH8232313.1 conserved hypothetical protein [Vibrio aestuarianus]